MTVSTPLHSRVRDVTDRVRDRSRATRADYVTRMRSAGDVATMRSRLSCTNLAHGFAASSAPDKDALKHLKWPNLAIVTAYNDNSRDYSLAHPAALVETLRNDGTRRRATTGSASKAIEFAAD
jgi:hypothetical protein